MLIDDFFFGRLLPFFLRALILFTREFFTPSLFLPLFFGADFFEEDFAAAFFFAGFLPAFDPDLLLAALLDFLAADLLFDRLPLAFLFLFAEADFLFDLLPVDFLLVEAFAIGFFLFKQEDPSKSWNVEAKVAGYRKALNKENHRRLHAAIANFLSNFTV